MNTSELAIQQQILVLRGKQTLLDRDLAKIYQVDTKVLKVLRQKVWIELISLFPRKYTIALKLSIFLKPRALVLAS